MILPENDYREVCLRADDTERIRECERRGYERADEYKDLDGNTWYVFVDPNNIFED